MNKIWPAEQTERRDLATLVPSVANAKQHPPAQIDQIAASILEWGWTIPVLIDEANNVIAGHGRILAAQRLAISEIPVVVARGWTDAQKRAYLIADNRLSEGGSWDYEILQKELTALGALGFDINLAGFSADELQKLDEELREQQQQDWRDTRETLTEQQKGALDTAWRTVVKEWSTFAKQAVERGFLTSEFTRATLHVYFVRALLFSEDIPRAATLPYTLHRLHQASDGKGGGIYADLFDYIEDSETVIQSIQWACGDKPSLRKLVSLTLPIHGHRYPPDFPALLARDLIEEFAPDDALILDPCHGWGGRLLGFLLSNKARGYHGYDVDEKTMKGVQEMFDDLRGYVGSEKAIALTLAQFEHTRLHKNHYDFALTSPPYFNVEHYDGDKQSWKLYQTFDEWTEKFFKPLIHKTCDALKPGAVFALQIGSQHYPLRETALALLPKNLEHVETRNTEMTNEYAQTDPDDGEQILILRKREAVNILAAG